MSFYDFDFTDELLDSLDAMRFNEPTPIQAQAIPVIMEGKDLIACAQTGTGKTAAYLLPIIDDLVLNPNDGVDTIILVPTRELAIQIDQQMGGFGYFVSVSSTAIYGGSDSGEWSRQRTALTEGSDIVIATPGRLLQHIAMGYVDFSKVRHLVLDEADRMLDMGFFDDIMQVVKLLPVETRQTLMFSATMPPKIRELAKSILRDPAEISIAIAKPAAGIRQAAYPVYEAQKGSLIVDILNNHEKQSIIIFGSRKQSVKELGHTLKRKGFNAGVIHSDLEQTEREEVLREFRNRRIEILVATDVIARGIDIPDVDVVINFDVPRDAEDYVHRIGRTARAQSKGEAFTLIVPDEMYAFGRIEKLIEQTVEKLPLPEGLGEQPTYDPNTRSRGGRGSNGRGGQHSGGQRGGHQGNNRNGGNRNGGHSNRPRRDSNAEGKSSGDQQNAAEAANQQPQQGESNGNRNRQGGGNRGNHRHRHNGGNRRPNGPQAPQGEGGNGGGSQNGSATGE